MIRNHERVYVELFPDGSSKVGEPTDSKMHTFTRIGEGWCIFEREPEMLEKAGTYETTCRQACVERHPSCEGYAFDQPNRLCEIYKRREPAEPVVAVDGSIGVLCYQQNDTVFDKSSNVFMSEVRITHPDGTTQNYTTELFCTSRKGLSSLPHTAAVPPRLKHTNHSKPTVSFVGSVLNVGRALWHVAANPSMLLEGDSVGTLWTVINDLWRIFSSPLVLRKVVKDIFR